MGHLLAALTLFGASSWEGAAFAQHEERVGDLVDPYWARRAEVVQPRARRKEGAVELVALVGVIPNDPFVFYIPVGLRGAYHFNQRWSLEGSFAYNFALDTGLAEELPRYGAPGAWLKERQRLRGGVNLLWSPLYGKVSVGEGVLHFDGYLLSGAGVILTDEAPVLHLPSAVRPDFCLGLGLRAFLGGRWVLRLEYRQYLFLRPAGDGGGGGVGLASEVSLSGGLLLGGAP